MEKEKKCIIFLRVSTTSQSTDGQSENVIKMAERAGYSRQQMIFISEQESGIKLTEEERLGINKMKKFIAEDTSINCVFVSEVSRIARTKKVLFSVEEWLVKNKIQLSIYEPRIDLLNPDGSVNDAAETIFTLYAQFAESEMRTKKLRFAYGKRRSHDDGRWTGEKLPIGYSVDDDKHIIIDEEGAYIVRTIYNMYSSGEWSIPTLHKELSKLGITFHGQQIAYTRLAKILRNERFTGLDNYPPIITQELFEKCKNLRIQFKTVKKNNYVSQSLCNRLIKCPCCGSHLSSSGRTYRCHTRHRNPSGCDYKIEISTDVLDDIVWKVAAELEVSDLMTDNHNKRRQYEKEIEVLNLKINQFDKRFPVIQKRKDRIKELVIDGFLTTQEANDKLKQIEGQERALYEEKQALLNDVERLQKLLEAASAPGLIKLEDIERLSSTLPEDVKKKKTIVRRQIKDIKLGDWYQRPVNGGNDMFSVGIKYKKCIDVSVEDIYGFVHNFRYWPRWSWSENRIESL